MKDLDEAIRIDAAHPEARFNRALVRVKAEDLKGAIEDLTQAPAFRAQVRGATGAAEGAREDARRALELGVGGEARAELERLLKRLSEDF